MYDDSFKHAAVRVTNHPDIQFVNEPRAEQDGLERKFQVVAFVLLPGMDGTGTLFSEFIASLPSGVQPIVVTYPRDEPLGYSELEALVSEKLPNRPFILVGESFSGPIAIAIAAAAPIGLRGLILVGSFARNPIPGPSVLTRLLSWLPFWRAPVSVAAAMLLGRWSSKAQRARLSTAMLDVGPAAWRTRLRAVLSVDVVSQLRAVAVPVLYLRGKQDRVISKSAYKLIKETLSSARVVELDGPHFLLQAKPVESAAEVVAFAREVGFAL